MTYQYKTKGVCSRKIHLVIEDGIIKDVVFDGGCNGNAQGVAALVRDMDCETAIQRLKGIRCGQKMTSCPDQLAIALAAAMHH